MATLQQVKDAIVEEGAEVKAFVDSLSPSPPPLGRLAFAGAPLGSGQISRLLDNVYIDGLALGCKWLVLEPGFGVFDWAALDAALNIAKEHGKQCALYVSAHSETGAAIAAWIKAAGIQTYTALNFLGKTHEYPVPWDSIYLGKFTAFLAELSTHLEVAGFLRTVTRVGVSAPANEMTIPGCPISGQAYDRAIYLAAWKQMIDAYQFAFSSAVKHICAPTGGICGRDNDATFYRDVMAYAPSSFVLFATDLRVDGSARMRPYLDLVGGRSLALQPIWYVTGDTTNRVGGTVQQMVDAGIALGADYIEIYSADVLNPDPLVQAAIKEI